MSDVQSIKQRLSLQQWKEIIADRNASGLKIDEYCDLHHLSRNSYFYWLRKIREEAALGAASITSAPALVNSAPGAIVELIPPEHNKHAIPRIDVNDGKPENIEFTINGIGITVSSNFSEELLTKIMRAARNA